MALTIVDVQTEAIIFPDNEDFSATQVLNWISMALSSNPLPAILVERRPKGHYKILANVGAFLVALALGHKTVKVQIHE